VRETRGHGRKKKKKRNDARTRVNPYSTGPAPASGHIPRHHVDACVAGIGTAGQRVCETQGCDVLKEVWAAGVETVGASAARIGLQCASRLEAFVMTTRLDAPQGG
jgi:hypothetical protein